MRNCFSEWRSAGWRRAILFRGLAVLLGLLPFLVIELGLRAFGLGRSDWHEDPFVGFSAVRPLFELDDSGERLEIARSKRTHFYPESFALRKEPNEFRIFCIGDSTVQGNPWTTETSFTTWLEISLNSAEPARRWDVINCGGISYASYRMVPILEEVLRYQPDLIIVHCSHNEFLEDRTYGDLKRTPRWLWRVQEQVSRLRLYNVLRSMTGKPKRSLVTNTGDESVTDSDGKRPVMTAEVEALLDYRGGLELYHRDDAWQRGVIAHYEFNLRRMTSIAQQAGVPLILMNPACNLRDSPPFKAEHRTSLTEREQQQWDDLWAQARKHYASQPVEAMRLLREALAIDDQYAGLHYDLAKCYDSLSQFNDARAEYRLAKELDVCPLRILEPMNDIVRQVANDTHTPIVDVRALFDRLSRDGIPGSDWFADHVHPTIPGYQRVADETADVLEQLKILHPQPEWLVRKQQLYGEHLTSLPPNYLIEGQRRLRSLMLWAYGRVTKERPSVSQP
ncbi:MAG: tetratricopeptide repeat protein [Planctomycetaceae bacterium]|nr:tetratricopeptide repeat protein [Planctomycetaceae bacterium]